MASETARDVLESYSHERVGTLPEHPFERSKISELLGLEITSTWGTNERNNLLNLLEENHFGQCWICFATILYTWHKQVTQKITPFFKRITAWYP